MRDAVEDSTTSADTVDTRSEMKDNVKLLRANVYFSSMWKQEIPVGGNAFSAEFFT